MIDEITNERCESPIVTTVLRYLYLMYTLVICFGFPTLIFERVSNIYESQISTESAALHCNFFY